jgi:hypothetical protein
MSPYEDMAVHNPGRHAKLVGWQSLRDMIETGYTTVEQLEALL